MYIAGLTITARHLTISGHSGEIDSVNFSITCMYEHFSMVIMSTDIDI